MYLEYHRFLRLLKKTIILVSARDRECKISNGYDSQGWARMMPGAPSSSPTRGAGAQALGNLLLLFPNTLAGTSWEFQYVPNAAGKWLNLLCLVTF